MSQDIPVQFRDSVRVNRPGQKVCEFLVPPGFSPVSWRPVFIQRHKIMCPFVSVFVQIGGISVVPILLELLSENTFGRELLLKTKRELENAIAPGLCSSNTNRNSTYRSIQLSCVIHPQIEPAVHSFNAYQPNGEAYELQYP